MVTSKATGAAIGGGVGVAVADIGIWIAETAAIIDIPDQIETAIGIVVVAILAWVTTYKAPANTP